MEYKDINAVNFSTLKYILRSPAHYKHILENPPKQSDEMRIGSLIHLAALEPERYINIVKVAPDCDRRTKEGKAIFEAFKQSCNPGDEIVTEDDKILIDSCSLSARAAISRLAFVNPQNEVPLTTEISGINIKGRLDIIDSTRNEIADIKTCDDASPSAVARTIVNYNYHMQQAMYKRLSGQSLDTRAFLIFIEKKPPYCWKIYSMDPEMLEAGNKLFERALTIYNECLAWGNWPGYTSNIETISLPKWALNNQTE
jgi:exodeoxyribonuclease VIII